MNDFAKNVLIALLPILISGVVYLMNQLAELQNTVQVLQAKVSLVVTDDNKQAVNTGAELAREKLRQELVILIEENKDAIAVNRQDIAVLTQQIIHMQEINEH